MRRIKTKLAIRKISMPVFEKLRIRAEHHNRSMRRDVLAILEAANAEPVPALTPQEFLSRVQGLGIKSPSEAAEIIRKDRDSR